MEYKVEEISPVEKKVNVHVPAEEVGGALAAAIAMYKTRVDIKGFRKGKAPANVIERKFQKQIYDESKTDLINVHINEILSEMEITPLSGLNVDAGDFVRGEDYDYSFSFEVAPEIDLPAYMGVEVEEEAPEADEEEVKKIETRILENLAEVKVIEEDRKPMDGDVVTISFKVMENGEVLDGIEADNFELTLGEGQSLPEFEEVVKELTTGQSGEKEVTFPADFINTRLADKKATIHASLHAIKEKVLPEMSDEVAKKAGFQDVETMREGIRASYMSSRKQLYKSQAQKRVVDKLMEGLDFSLPPQMVEERIDRLIAELERSLDRKGKSIQSLGKTKEELRSEYREQGEDMARTELFLLAVATEEGLQVGNEELDGVYKTVAEQTGQSFYDVKNYYEQHGLVIPLKDRLLADKAIELIYENAKIKEVPVGSLDDNGEKEGAGE